MSVRSMLNSQAVLKSKGTKTSDDMGGYTLGDESTLDTVPCRLRQLSGQEETVYDKASNEKIYRMYIEPNTSLEGTDWVVIDSNSYEIININNVNLDGRLMQVDLNRITK